MLKFLFSIGLGSLFCICVPIVQGLVISKAEFFPSPTLTLTPTMVVTPTVIPSVTPSPTPKYTKEGVIKAINKHLDGGRLTRSGHLFYKAYEDHGVSAMLMASIAYFESRVYIHNRWVAGLSKNTFRINNFNGMNRRTGFKSSGRYTDYDSIEQAIDDMGYWLRYCYLDGNNAKKKKCKSIYDIAEIYCPVDDPDNGKFGMQNEMWPEVVENKFNAIQKDAIKFSY